MAALVVCLKPQLMKELISDESKRLVGQSNCFDVLRYYFAFVVVFAHFAVLSGGSYEWVTTSGEAVSGFFTLSGFLVYYSFVKNKDLRVYAKRRMRRILPPYIFIVVTCVVAGILLTSLTAGEYLGSWQLWKYLIANACFMNFLEPCLPGVFDGNPIAAVNGSLWTMKVEVLLYISVPITYYFFKRYNKALVLAVIFVLSIAYREFFLHLYTTRGNAIYEIMSRQVGAQLVYFYSGTAILFYFDKFQKHVKYLLPTALLLYIGAKLFPALSYLSPFAFAVVIIGFAYNFKWLNFLSRYGNVSYGVYLFHFPVIQVIVHYKLHEWNFYAALAMAIVATLLLACISWKLIEEPILHRPTKPART